MGLKGGVLVGTIGGLVGGVVNLIVELYRIRRFPEPRFDVPLTVSTVEAMIVVAIVAGIIFGASYAKLYPHLWGGELIKGVYYSLLLWMYYIMLGFIIAIVELFLGVGWAASFLEQPILHFVLGRGPMWIVCGAVVGVLYERIDRTDDIGWKTPPPRPMN